MSICVIMLQYYALQKMEETKGLGLAWIKEERDQGEGAYLRCPVSTWVYFATRVLQSLYF